MHLTTVILLLLFITALTNLAVTVVRVPLPLLQIAVGAVCDLLGFHVAFDPALFLLLFIPPLLFSDAYRIPKRELTEAGVPVFMLSVGLVIFTTFGVGSFVHWLLPFVPLAAALALAAVLSPTDAVALSGILNGRALPRRFMHVLQGEALLNDASGLVSFNFAVATVAGVHFSLGVASLEFLAVALGGILIGAILGWAFFQLDKRVLSHHAGEASIYVVLVMLLPFAAYLAAEELGLSGILAAVTAGLVLNLLDPFGGSHGATRRHVFSLWRILEFAFNGLIFLLLGLQLPSILGGGIQRAVHAGYSPWALPLLIVFVTGVLILLRFAWVLMTSLLRTGVHRVRRRGQRRIASFGALALASVAGVRGAVTLAGILSLPLFLPDGSQFPARSLLISVAAGVIVLSLLIAVVCVPLLLRRLGQQDEDPFEAELAAARQQMAESAMRELEERVEDGLKRREGTRRNAYEEAGSRVLADYRLRLDGRDDGNDGQEQAREDKRAEMALRLRGVRAERAEMRRLRQHHAINDEAVQILIEELDLAEEALSRVAASLPARREAAE
ncbi:Na+/H+ antiporter [Acidisoma silvae]|uniref:Na+/H+ antiporter n=2 Tax=Acidisoma silvae TaxID=2802396 RepID=A0A964E0C3_9PROT|nr:Na+/H+ antiporter [Acidisoma silvae]